MTANRWSHRGVREWAEEEIHPTPPERAPPLLDRHAVFQVEDKPPDAVDFAPFDDLDGPGSLELFVGRSQPLGDEVRLHDLGQRLPQAFQLAHLPYSRLGDFVAALPPRNGSL